MSFSVTHIIAQLAFGFRRAPARKKARSDRVFLDLLFLLYQDKRKSKNS